MSMNPLDVEMRDVAGRSIMTCDGGPVLTELRMRAPEDGEAFGSEMQAMLVMPVEDPAAVIETAIAEIDLDDAPDEEALEAMIAMISDLRERVADMDMSFAPMPFSDDTPVFQLSMN